MASPAGFATPSPPGSIRTPTTPRHGFADSWEPFSPRKSARISSRKRTPSPTAASSSTRPTQKSLFSQATNSTPATSPQKKRQPAMDSVRRRVGPLAADGSAQAAQLLGQDRQHKPTGARPQTMLPTPSKTPRKPTSEKTQAEVSAVARNLFSDTDSLSTPRKRKAKAYSGLTLDSFTAEDMEQPIEIFTDSRDRVPVADASAENPFYNQTVAAAPETEKRRSRRKVAIPGEGRQTVDEAVQREDGIVYVFRGKKIFRKFTDIEDQDSNDSGNDELGASARAQGSPSPQTPRRSTRSSVKPRLLFPSSEKDKTTSHEDEEAMTDIEDHVREEAASELAAAETPSESRKEANTPKAPRFAPCSPPSTTRTTRYSNKLLSEESPLKRPTKSRSPFDGWRRSKSRAEPQGQKREAEHAPAGSEVSKRQRA